MPDRRVVLRPSGRGFACPDDKSVLDAALAAGVALSYGCRTGTCGACRARLLAGRVDPGPLPPLGLTDEERATDHVLLCQARPLADLELEVGELEPGATQPVKTLPARVARLERFGHDVMGLWLKLPPVERLPFRAGQYLDVLLPDGRRRSFSLANPPHDDALLELHVRLVPGGAFTGQVFAPLASNALLRVQGPLGRFWVRDDARPILMLAGGTGFAPLQAMVEHALAAGDPRPIHLYWGARASRDLYREARVAEWRRRHPAFRYTPVLSEPEPGWSGRRGWVHEALLEDRRADLAAHAVYLAGPPAMCVAARAAFRAAGLPDDQLHYDSFDYSAR